MADKLVSVIIPVYNTKEYLSRSVGSILAQTYASWELLLIDDGSTDGSGELCNALSAKDARIRTLHFANGGVSVARNRGVRESRGEYLCFIDSDDFVAVDYLERLVEAAERTRSSLVVTKKIILCSNEAGAAFAGQENAAEGQENASIAGQENAAAEGQENASITGQENAAAEGEANVASEGKPHIPVFGKDYSAFAGRSFEVLKGKGTALRLYLDGKTDYASFVSSCGKLYARKLLENRAFDAARSYGEDAVFVTQCLIESERTCICQYAGYYYWDVREGSLTAEIKERVRTGDIVLRGYDGYGQRTYTTLSLVLKTGDKAVYDAARPTLEKVCGWILGRNSSFTEKISKKHRVLLAFYYRCPNLYWRVIGRLIPVIGRWARDKTI